MLALLDVMTALRAPSGCAWDREQTVASLRGYLLEETHEVLDVIDRLDPDSAADAEEHRKELGDLLFQIVFQTEIQREQGRFDFGDVADTIRHKLERRHPHVFGDAEPGSPEVSWEALKRKEREGEPERPQSALSGVPHSLPALLRALRVGQKAHAIGFDWPDHRGVIAKIREELAEVEEAIDDGNAARIEDELGDLLYAIVNLCRHKSVDPEAALRSTMRKFESRFRLVEDEIAALGKRPEACTLDELEAAWERAKIALKTADEAER